MSNDELISRPREREYCADPCNGPVCGYSDAERLLHRLCAVVLLYIVPVRYMMWWPFRWMLPFWGNHAYACTCREKNIAALRARKEASNGQG